MKIELTSHLIYKMDDVLVVFAWRGDFGVVNTWREFGGGALWNVC